MMPRFSFTRRGRKPGRALAGISNESDGIRLAWMMAERLRPRGVRPLMTWSGCTPEIKEDGAHPLQISQG